MLTRRRAAWQAWPWRDALSRLLRVWAGDWRHSSAVRVDHRDKRGMPYSRERRARRGPASRGGGEQAGQAEMKNSERP